MERRRWWRDPLVRGNIAGRNAIVTTFTRHARPCAGHPRPSASPKAEDLSRRRRVDGWDKPGHDVRWLYEAYALACSCVRQFPGQPGAKRGEGGREAAGRAAALNFLLSGPKGTYPSSPAQLLIRRFAPPSPRFAGRRYLSATIRPSCRPGRSCRAPSGRRRECRPARRRNRRSRIGRSPPSPRRLRAP